MASLETKLCRSLLALCMNFQLLENKRKWQSDSRQRHWLTMSLTGPSRTKLLTALLPGNPIILTTTKSGSMCEIWNVEVIMNLLIRSSRDPRKKQTTLRLITTALNPKFFEKVAYIKSIHIKVVISSS